jgi:hypothetical protein
MSAVDLVAPQREVRFAHINGHRAAVATTVAANVLVMPTLLYLATIFSISGSFHVLSKSGFSGP